MKRLLTTFGVLTVLAAPVTAQDHARRIEQLTAQHLDTIVQLRHHIHEHPELSNREFETAALVARHLRALGLEVETGIAHTGVVGILRGGRSGPVVAVRADMDALPVIENTDLPFASEVRTSYLGQEVGVMHACGHDVHTASLLGVAHVLAAMRERIPGTVMFIFQPAEEGVPPGERGGAELMLEEGVFGARRPAAVFGLHTWAQLEVGKLAYTPGPAFAAVDHFLIEIQGKQAHGASPHLSIDPVVMASQVVLALQTIRSRNLPPLEPSVVTVGIVRGGTRFNIIPDAVHLEGTVRTYDTTVQNEVERRMREILDGITKAGGGSFTLEYQRNTPATINDVDLTRRMVPTLERVVGAANVEQADPTMGGEDFAYFANEVPGFYFRVGQVAPGTESGDHHTPTYRADDAMIPIAIRAMANLVMDFLSRGGR